ncbi:SulP family inorganic anion transporter [Hydrotalea sp.]|uniref:SulP family inorganic anion transporter n=1 Tax=Hydrotalea sp. TaxID=2881279 RepID=UPI002625709A|nr:SulP family inorganic anion transporter [Hydrotalea sp.]
MKNYFQTFGKDFPASIVVVLVALPLCLGIALGSGAPLFSGIIAGIVGGIVIGLLSGSHLSVSGPAAGLTVIVATAIAKLQVYEAFLLAVVIAGILQMVLGFLKAGILGDYVPNAVIKGMLAAIGLLLILKQIPHLVGYNANFIGDESFKEANTENTFTAFTNFAAKINEGALLIGIVALFILIVWDGWIVKKIKKVKLIPGALLAVIAGTMMNQYFKFAIPFIALQPNHLVSLPVVNENNSFLSFFTFPNWSFITNKEVWIAAVTIAIVASLETLLSIEAIDNLDPLKRATPTNRELRAQGVGNFISGLIGGIPVTSVIVRSSANVYAGAKTKASAVMHGVILLLFVLFIPEIINHIPLSALAAILIFTGYKLAKVSLFKEFYSKGWDQLIPFVITIVAILLTDLLIGIFIGCAVALFFLIRSNFRSAVLVVNDTNNYLIRLRKDVSFLNKPVIKEKLEEIPENSFVLIDVTRADFIDKDVIEEINHYMQHAHLKNVKVEIKKSRHKSMHRLFSQQNEFQYELN